jgi:TatD DNase family protein
MIETHCHLDYLKQAPLDEIIQRSLDAGIEKIITIAVDPENLDVAFNLAQDNPNIFCSQGIHPHDAIKATDADLEKISTRMKDKKVIAVGEIGLDFYYNHSSKDVQIDIFKKQIEIAIAQNMPVIIHSRDADTEMIEVLAQYQDRMNKKGVVHSFSSGLELAQKAIDWGFYLGFNGMVTFKSADNVRTAVELCPIEQLLLETDAPFLTPIPHRGKENAPFYLPFIAHKISEIKNLNNDDVIKITTANAKKLFALS